MLIVGMTAATAGVAAGGAAQATEQEVGNDLPVTEWCDDGTNYLLLENPTTEAVDVSTAWTGNADDATSIQVESERFSEAGAEADAQAARTQLRTDVDTDDTGTTYTLTLTVPADGYLLFVDLPDGAYEFSTESEDATLERTEVELECETAVDDDGSETERAADDVNVDIDVDVEIPPAVSEGIDAYEDEIAAVESDGSFLVLSADSDLKHVTKYVITLEKLDVDDAVAGLEKVVEDGKEGKTGKKDEGIVGERKDQEKSTAEDRPVDEKPVEEKAEKEAAEKKGPVEKKTEKEPVEKKTEKEPVEKKTEKEPVKKSAEEKVEKKESAEEKVEEKEPAEEKVEEKEPAEEKTEKANKTDEDKNREKKDGEGESRGERVCRGEDREGQQDGRGQEPREKRRRGR
ncbi:AAA family ATPase [Natronobacterium lacisalsi]|nr:AAA family ATPase [Halobiforma lacisalsi]